MTSFDPYYQWLGIRDPQRPPDHYRLLGLELFEDDPQVISIAADRQMAHLRTFQNGPRGAESQKLLNEVAAARVCLLDRSLKAAYDAQLKRPQSSASMSEPAETPREEVTSIPRIQIATPTSPVRLNKPGRGNRDRSPLKLILAATLVVFLLSVGTWYYRYQIDRSAQEAIAPAPKNNAATPDHAASDELKAAGSNDRSAEGDRSNSVGSSTEAEATANRSPNEKPDDRLADGTAESQDSQEAEPANPAPADDGDPGSLSNGSPDPAVTVDRTLPPLDWNPEDLQVVTQPLKFGAQGLAAPLWDQIQHRRLDETRKVMTEWLKAGRSPLDSLTETDLQLVFDLVDQFWSAVDEQLKTLKTSDSFTFREWTVTVAARNAQVLTLESATGKRHEFDMARAKMHRDLAIGLVRRHFSQSPGTAERLIGIFLLVDQQGNVELAREHWQRAAELGFPAEFLEGIVRRHVVGDLQSRK